MHRLHASGESVSGIVRRTGLGRKRVTRRITLLAPPKRNTMEPKPQTPALYQDYLAKAFSQ
jgi:hypothetical protein